WLGWRSHEWWSHDWRSERGDGRKPYGRLARIQLASRPFLPSWTVRKSPPFFRTSPPQVLLRRSTNLRRRIRLRLLALGTDRVGTTPHLGLRRLLLSETPASSGIF